MAISSPGIGSNLDVNGIISQLMSVERKPLTVLARKEASFQAKLSGFGTLKGSLSQFQAAVRALSDGAKFQAMRATSSDSAVLTASATAAAAPGSHTLEVTQLARAQKLVAAGQASSTAAIGSGASTTVSFEFGTISGGTFDSSTGKYTGAGFTGSGGGVKTLTLDASNNTLAGIRDAINKAGVGVSATIVNDGGSSPHRLALSVNATGKAHSVRISVSGDTTLQGLLAHNPGSDTGQALAENLSARNAEFKLDGLAVSKASNTVTDVLQGVTLNLAKTNSGSPASITVARDTASVTAGVESFVKAYNDLAKTFKEATAYDPSSKRAAILNGESSVRSIEAQVRSVLSAPVGGAGAFTLLSQIGVSPNKDGLLTLDSSKLQGAIEKNFGEIAALFAAAGRTSDPLASYVGATAATRPGAYQLEVTRLATQGKSTGSAAAGLTITAGSNDTLQVLLDGVSATVTLGAGSYASAAALAAEVQSRINGAAPFADAGASAVVTESGGVLTITSARFGSASKAAVTGGSGMSNLMGAAPTATDGLDVAGKINGVAAAGNGQTLTGAVGNAAEGLQVKVTGGGTGLRGTASHSHGYAHQFNRLMEAQLGAGGVLASRTDGLNASIKGLDESKARLMDRLAATEKRYRQQFTKLDATLSSMLSTGNFLTQQLASLARNDK